MSNPAQGPAELDLFDYAYLRNLVGFVLNGVRRHRLLTAVSFSVVLGLGLAMTALWPRSWHAESRLLANQNQLIRTLGNPRTSLPSEDPINAAREIVFAHDNLVSLIKQTNMMEQWNTSRPTLLRLRDSLSETFGGATTDEQKLDAMVGTLEKKLRVDTEQHIVNISVDWPDPQMAYLIVETAQQNFLETRHVTEMTAISEALSILEAHAAEEQKNVEDALRELERVRELRRKGSGGPAPVAPVREGAATTVQDDAATPHAPPPANEQELAQLKFLLNSKRRALADLEDFRSRRAQELNAQLVEQRVQYADQHPVVLDTMQRIDALKKDSPQMAQVKGDIDHLIEEYRRKGGKDPDSLVEPSRPRAQPRRAQQQAELSNSELSDDPLVEFTRNNLRVVSAKYEELMMRIDGARIEQDTARAAFKYRYSVVRPASVPRKPVSPNAAVLVAASVVAALFVGLFIGALRDVTGGHIVEAWQVERALKLKVLSRVKV